MSYLIAVATSDAKVVDLGFGAAKGFHIYEVDGTEYKEKEYREFAEEVCFFADMTFPLPVND